MGKYDTPYYLVRALPLGVVQGPLEIQIDLYKNTYNLLFIKLFIKVYNYPFYVQLVRNWVRIVGNIFLTVLGKRFELTKYLAQIIFPVNNENPTYEKLRGKPMKTKIILFKLIFFKNISISLYSNLFPLEPFS